jgi:hypothetical protein
MFPAVGAGFLLPEFRVCLVEGGGERGGVGEGEGEGEGEMSEDVEAWTRLMRPSSGEQDEQDLTEIIPKEFLGIKLPMPSRMK